MDSTDAPIYHVPSQVNKVTHYSTLLTTACTTVHANFRRLQRRRQVLLLALAALGLFVIMAVTISILIPDEMAPTTTTPILHGVLDSTVGPFNGTFIVITAATLPPIQVDIVQHGTAISGTETQISCKGTMPQLLKVTLTGTLLNESTLLLKRTAADTSDEQIIYSIDVHHLRQADIVVTWHDASGLPQFQRWTTTNPSEFTQAAISFCQH